MNTLLMRTMALLACVSLIACSESNSSDTDAGTQADAMTALPDGDAAPMDAPLNTPPDAASLPDGARDGATIDGAATAAFLLNEYCMPFANAACQARVDCACEADVPFDTCVVSALSECMNERYVGLATTGAIAYDADRVRAAVARYESTRRSCRESSEVYDAIHDAFFVPVNVGEPCAGDELDYLRCAEGKGLCVDYQCVATSDEGSSCSRGCSSGLTCAEGEICEALPADGAACSIDRDCNASQVCNGSTCVTPAAVGESCATLPCGRGLSCTSGTCEATHPSCESDLDCNSNEFCNGTYYRECSVRSDEGQTCDSHDQCATGLLCAATDFRSGTCETAPTLGQDCSRFYACAPGLVCSYETSLCVEPPSLGEACVYGGVFDGSVRSRGYSGCATGLGCIDGYCVTMPGIDEPCDDNGFCVDDAYCAYEGSGDDWSTTCRAKRGVAESCDSYDSCIAGTFCDSRMSGDGTGYCTQHVSVGETCDGSEQCEAGLYCRWLDDSSGACTLLPTLSETCDSECTGAYTCRSYLRDAFCYGGACGGSGIIEPF